VTELSSLPDPQQIHALHALWAQRRADGDPHAWAELYTEDGRYVRPSGEVCQGRDGVAHHAIDSDSKLKPGNHIAHIRAPMVMRISGDIAETAVDFVSFRREPGDERWRIPAIGRFRNKLAKQGGRWLFQETLNFDAGKGPSSSDLAVREPGWAQSDEEKIRESLGLWAQYMDDKNTAGSSAMYAEDGVHIRPTRQEFRGRSAVKAGFDDMFDSRPRERQNGHMTGASIIRVRGDQAESSTSYLGYVREAGSTHWGLVAAGRVQCEHVRIDGRWYFKLLQQEAYYLGDPAPNLLRGVSGVTHGSH
jgi:uncharacterized protein (TIGR02246 family)